MADIIQRVIDNVKSQSIITAQLNAQQQQIDNLRSQSLELSGQMKLLAELYKDDTGEELNNAINRDDSLKQLIIAAQQDGIRIAGGNSEDNASESKATIGEPKIVDHKANKKVREKKEPVLAGRTSDRALPKIVIDDDPPKQGDDED